MATAVATTAVQTKLKEFSTKLRNSHSKWKEHQLKSNTMLYVLIEDCVEFYRFLKKDERYESTFKTLFGTKIHSNRTLSSLVAEHVFGKGKQTSAYAKVIAIAIEDGYGTEDNVSVLEWIQSVDGGINAIIRKEPKDNEAQRRQYKTVVDNYFRFLKTKRNLINAEDFIKERGFQKGNEQVVIIKCVDETTVDIIDWSSNSDSLRTAMFEDMAKQIMDTEEYRKNEVEVQKQIDAENAEAEEALVEYLETMEAKQKERTDEQNSQTEKGNV